MYHFRGWKYSRDCYCLVTTVKLAIANLKNGAKIFLKHEFSIERFISLKELCHVRIQLKRCLLD